MTKEPQTTPNLQKFSVTRYVYDQAWVWSPGCNDWVLCYDTKDAWKELNDLPSIGIRKPDPLPMHIERVPRPKLSAKQEPNLEESNVHRI